METEPGNRSCITPAQVGHPREYSENSGRVEVRRKKESKSTQYQLKQVIGKGSYGIVYKAVNKITGDVVAIKEINYGNDEELNEIMIEIDLLKNLDHINIVKYHGFIQKMSNLYIILEYASKGSLKNLMSTRLDKCLTEEETQKYIYQTLNGLSYLHGQGVIHRDIKAANLLLDSNNIVKLADFGVSTKVNNTAMTLAGSLNWMAPEIVTNKGASTLSDIWSLGATVVELLTGKPPFHNLLDINIYYAMENKEETYYPPSSLSTETRKFLDLCLQKNMFKRATANELLTHPWVNGGVFIIDKNNKDTNNSLSKFEEDFDGDEEANWDADFKENEINSVFNLNVNYADKNYINESPLKSTPIKKGKGLNKRLSQPENNFGLPVQNHLFNNKDQTNNKNDHLNKFKETDNDDGNNWFDEYTADIDDSLLYDGYYYLTLLTKTNNSGLENGNIQNISDDKIEMIFTDCQTFDILDILFEYFQTNKTNLMPNYLTFITRIFEKDQEINKAKLMSNFTKTGGIPLIIGNCQILSIFYKHLNDSNKELFFQTMFQSGITNNTNVNNFKSNLNFYFELIYKYLEHTQIRFWYRWCQRNIDLNLLAKCLFVQNSKKVQSIVMKLASVDGDAKKGGNNWMFEQFLPLLVKHAPSKTSSPQLIYVILKTVTYLLQYPKTMDILNQIPTQLQECSSNERRTNSVSSIMGTISMTPMVHSPMKPQRILSNQYFKSLNPSSYENGDSLFKNRGLMMSQNNSSNSIEGYHNKEQHLNSNTSIVKLPKLFTNWLLSFMKVNNRFMINDTNNNIHVWKYFIKVCYISSKLNKDVLVQLSQDQNFVDLINKILNRYQDTKDRISSIVKNNGMKQDKRNLKSTIQTLMLLLVDISRLIDYPQIAERIILSLNDIITRVCNSFYDFIPLCIEYLLNVISSAMLPSSYFSDKIGDITRTLSTAFYTFDADDINFNSVINKYIKFCSLDDVASNNNTEFTKTDINRLISTSICRGIIETPHFVERIKLFFRIYENSLLIQIELLKLVKLLFNHCVVDPLVFEQICIFMNTNWKTKDSSEPDHSSNIRQVGRDSILITQLCNDIMNM